MMVYVLTFILYFFLNISINSALGTPPRYDELEPTNSIKKYYKKPTAQWSFKKVGHCGVFMIGTQELYIPLYRHFEYELYDVSENKTFTLKGSHILILFNDIDILRDLSLFRVTKHKREILFDMPLHDRHREILERQYFHHNPPEIAWTFLEVLDYRNILIASQEPTSPKSPRSPRTLFLMRTESSRF